MTAPFADDGHLSWRRGFFGQSRDFLRPGDVTSMTGAADVNL